MNDVHETKHRYEDHQPSSRHSNSENDHYGDEPDPPTDGKNFLDFPDVFHESGQELEKSKDDDLATYKMSDLYQVEFIGEGQGHTTTTFKATLGGERVVCKVSENIKELEIYLRIHDPQNAHFVKFLGICNDFSSVRPKINPQLAIITEYCSKKDLCNITEGRGCPPSYAKDLMLGMVRGLRKLQAKGVIHGDVALRNFVIGNDKYVKIIDFGLSRYVKNSQAAGDFKTENFSRSEASPETVLNNVISTKSDVWSLGVAFFMLLTGRKPFCDSWGDKQATRDLIHLKQYRKDLRIPEALGHAKILQKVIDMCCQETIIRRSTLRAIEEMLLTVGTDHEGYVKPHPSNFIDSKTILPSFSFDHRRNRCELIEHRDQFRNCAYLRLLKGDNSTSGIYCKDGGVPYIYMWGRNRERQTRSFEQVPFLEFDEEKVDSYVIAQNDGLCDDEELLQTLKFFADPEQGFQDIDDDEFDNGGHERLTSCLKFGKVDKTTNLKKYLIIAAGFTIISTGAGFFKQILEVIQDAT